MEDKKKKLKPVTELSLGGQLTSAGSVPDFLSFNIVLIKYLGRYTHRIAISNFRILSIDDDTVTISVRDYKNKGQKKSVTMQAVEFIRRFLMHILPKGFVKMRHYGLLANRNKKTKLARCRRLSKSPVYKPKYEGLSGIEVLSKILKRDLTLCPAYKKAQLKIVDREYIP